MKPSAFLFFLPSMEYPAFAGHSATSNIKLSSVDSVSGDLHFLSAGRKQLIADLRKLADELEKVSPEQFNLES